MRPTLEELVSQVESHDIWARHEATLQLAMLLERSNRWVSALRHRPDAGFYQGILAPHSTTLPLDHDEQSQIAALGSSGYRRQG